MHTSIGWSFPVHAIKQACICAYSKNLHFFESVCACVCVLCCFMQLPLIGPLAAKQQQLEKRTDCFKEESICNLTSRPQTQNLSPYFFSELPSFLDYSVPDFTLLHFLQSGKYPTPLDVPPLMADEMLAGSSSVDNKCSETVDCCPPFYHFLLTSGWYMDVSISHPFSTIWNRLEQECPV